MKSTKNFFFVMLISVAAISCSEDDEVKRKGDPDVTHSGDQWHITSIGYLLMDQSTSGQTVKTGTKENAGSFYFASGGENGSFEMNIEGYNKEDLFTYTISDQGAVQIFDIEQNAGGTVSQNVVVINGDATSTEMTLTGNISKQSTGGQFSLTITSMVLTKK